MSHQVLIHSNRFYFDSCPNINLLNDDLVSFNKYIFFAYNYLYNNYLNHIKTDQKALHSLLKSNFAINDYYANSIRNKANDMFSSQSELNKLYIKNNESKLKVMTDRLKKTQDKYTKVYSCFLNIRNIENKLKRGIKITKSDFKTWSGSGISFDINNPYQIILSNFSNKSTFGIYQFEYNYLIPYLHKLKNLISKLKYGINNLKIKIDNLKKGFHKICFGGASFIRKNQSNPFFKQMLIYKKYNELSVSGRCDAAFGNFVFKLTDNSLNLNTMKGVNLIFINIRFKYLGHELLSILKYNKDKSNKKKKPICFGYKIKIDKKNNKPYIIFTASFDRDFNKKFNESIDTGIIGIDFNYGHLDITNIDSKGNLIDFKTYKYNITDNKYLNEMNFKRCMINIGNYINSSHKIVAIENLNLEQLKAKCKYNNTRLNKSLHMLPYSKYYIYLEQEAIKHEFKVIKVSPKYTSQIGRYKYSYNKKLNIHIAASYCIARRGIGMSEKVNKEYRHLIPIQTTKKKYNTHLEQWIKILPFLK